MKKIENYVNCLDILRGADYRYAQDDPIYRTGVVGQFNLTFELAWKALKAVMQLDGLPEADTGSGRDIIKLAAKAGYIQDDAVWLLMLKERNSLSHIYNESELDAFLVMLRDSFMPAFNRLEDTLLKKQKEIEQDNACVNAGS